jgi:hypothetical protein
METFLEFVNKQRRDGKRHLTILEKVFKHRKMSCKSFMDEENPYLYLMTPNNDSFGGVRVYQIGDSIAYRVQKQENTEPFGRPYLLDLEEMYEDFMMDDIKEEEAAKRIIEAVADELTRFFRKSKEAEEDFRDMQFDRQTDSMGKIILRPTGTDYANTVFNKM